MDRITPIHTLARYQREWLQLLADLCQTQLCDIGAIDPEAQAFIHAALESVQAALRRPCYRQVRRRAEA
jgi:hypothetical protein